MGPSGAPSGAPSRIMKALETIHLRLAGNSPRTLVDVIRKSIDSGNEPMEVLIYRHTRLETNLAVHLHREVAGRSDRASDLGASGARNGGAFGVDGTG